MTQGRPARFRMGTTVIGIDVRDVIIDTEAGEYAVLTGQSDRATSHMLLRSENPREHWWVEASGWKPLVVTDG